MTLRPTRYTQNGRDTGVQWERVVPWSRGVGEAGVRENACPTTSICKVSSQVDVRRRDVTTGLRILIIIIGTITQHDREVSVGPFRFLLRRARVVAPCTRLHAFDNKTTATSQVSQK